MDHDDEDWLASAGRSTNSSDRTMLFAHGIVAATLYQTLVFIAGMWTNHPVAWFGIIVSAGLGYLSAFWQLSLSPNRPAAIVLVVVSILAGALAGLSLLW